MHNRELVDYLQETGFVYRDFAEHAQTDIQIVPRTEF
jgi:hypothetical protein